MTTTGSIKTRRRPFGSGKPVSLFTLGTMRALQSAGQLEAVVEAAIAAGINHLETAPAYGPAQRYLGQAIRRLGLSREQLVITSKVLPNQSLASAQDDVRRSLEQLGIDRLDNLAVHGINRPEHLEWALHGPGQELISWVLEEGLADQVGFSSHGSNELIAAAIRSGRFRFASLHLHFFDPARLPLADEALASGMGVMAISPADKGGRLFDPPELLRQACAPLEPLPLAYRFLLARGISTLTLGAAEPAELHWAGLDGSPLSDGGAGGLRAPQPTTARALGGGGLRPMPGLPALPATAADPRAAAAPQPGCGPRHGELRQRALRLDRPGRPLV